MLKIGGAVALVVVLGGTFWWQDRTIKNAKEEIAHLESNLALVGEYYARAVDEANANADALLAFKARAEEDIRAQEARHARELSRTKSLTKISTRIENVQKEDDGAVAPVLRDALSGLRELQAASTQNSRADQSGQAGDTARAP